MSRRGGLVKGKRKPKLIDKKSDPADSISQDMQKTHHEAQFIKVQSTTNSIEKLCLNHHSRIQPEKATDSIGKHHLVIYFFNIFLITKSIHCYVYHVHSLLILFVSLFNIHLT